MRLVVNRVDSGQKVVGFNFGLNYGVGKIFWLPYVDVCLKRICWQWEI